MLVKNLIFDIGMHRGEDTEFYLKKGYRVVAFEANPELIEFCNNKFQNYISQGTLTIIEGGIAPENAGSDITFYVSTSSVWGTARPEWAKRNEGLGAVSKEISVKRIDLKSYFTLFGTPYYVKIDIEGMDRYVLDVISGLNCKPKYISLESEKIAFSDLINEMAVFESMGYDSFKVVQQSTIPGTTATLLDIKGGAIQHVFPRHASGPFGEDIWQQWISSDDAIAQYKRIFHDYERSGDAVRTQELHSNQPVIQRSPGWFDTHAKLAEPVKDDNPLVSLVVTCNNKLENLKHTLHKYAVHPSMEVIVVGCGHPEDARDWAKRNFPEIQLVLDEGLADVSPGRARNSGALHARGKYLMFIDAGIHVDFPVHEWIIQHSAPGEFYTVGTKNDDSLYGISIIEKNDFHSAGGYDEAFQGPGSGWEHVELFMRLERCKLNQLRISGKGLVTMGHTHADKAVDVEKSGIESRKTTAMIDELYTRIKKDIFYQRQRELNFNERMTLMGKIREFVSANGRKNKPMPAFSIDFSDDSQRALSKLSLVYHFNKPM